MCQQTVIILMYIIHTLMSVPSYVRIENGSYGVNDFKLNKVHLYRSKTCYYQCFEACCPKTSSCASKLLLLRYKLVILQCLCQVSLGLKEVQMGAHDFKLKKVQISIFCSKTYKFQCFAIFCPKTGSCPSKPLLLLCKVVIRQCLFIWGPMTSK